MLPHAPVRRINRARPVIPLVITDGRGDGLLQTERRQRGNLRRIIIIRRAFAADGRDGQDERTQFRHMFQPAALAEK